MGTTDDRLDTLAGAGEYLVCPDDRDPIGTEWLLTNGLGGFAMGTVSGTLTRRYHGALIGATLPPVGRVIGVHTMVEKVILDPGPNQRVIDLSALEFAGSTTPPPTESLRAFEKDTVCRWHYSLGDWPGATLSRVLGMEWGGNASVLTYVIRRTNAPVRLELRPLISMRDFHELQHETGAQERFIFERGDRHVGVSADGMWLRIESNNAWFEPDPQWWNDLHYRVDASRGQGCTEDLFSPGRFIMESDNPFGLMRTRLRMSLECDEAPARGDAPIARRPHLNTLVAHTLDGDTPDTNPDARAIAALTIASDDFVVRRPIDNGPDEFSVIAGYPWFADWGRDTMICMPGLFLVTGRLDEAYRTLVRFGRKRRNGIVPNRFDDRTGDAHYNTVDASLWYIQAACSWYEATGSMREFMEELMPVCREIVHAYQDGTDNGIGTDPLDGLVFAGDETTQLTWMDAQRDGEVFTPRHGKAVEINALWYSGLRRLGKISAEAGSDDATKFERLASRTAAHFPERFGGGSHGGLMDRLEPSSAGGTWRPIDEVRPNQIFCSSLPMAAEGLLGHDLAASSVRCVRDRLLTPNGLRTLDADDPEYRARFSGPIVNLDAAYHNGTVWPWLLGPFAEALVRTGVGSADDARTALQPLVDRLAGECQGQAAEVFDGDDTPEQPSQPGGCPAQAWSIGELLRVLVQLRRGVITGP